MPINQDNRLLRIDTPLGKDIFVAAELHGEEANSELFQYTIELYSTELEIKPADIVGKKVTASIHLNKNQTRYINGIVNRFCAYGVEDGLRRYTATIVPSLWLLTLNQNNAIYAGKTSKDIIAELLKKSATDFKYHASENDKREYCIQYQESDFEFLSRIIAEEGLSYYFVHEEGKHDLIIVDKNSQYVDCVEKVVECEEENAGAATQLSRIIQWQRQYKMHAGKLEMTGYLESTAAKELRATVTTRNKILKLDKYSRSVHESAVPYGFKNELPVHGSSVTQKKTAELILEAEESGFDQANGTSNCCTFLSGGRFELKHRLKSESGKYLLTRVTHYVIANDTENKYSNHFCCVPASTPVHPAPPINRKRITGPHLATVLEVKAGDSPGAVDPQLMVKLKFYWDITSQSCWVRVMQNYAGHGEGAVFVPRVNSEVVVEFIGGDPDRPLVTGAVYNSENIAPQYSKTQSGFKTGGKNFNEFRFDDKAESEEVYLKAGKDYNYLVTNNETGDIKNDQSFTVGGKHKLTVTGGSNYKSNDSITIEAAKSITLKVGSNSIVIDTSGITLKASKIKGTADTSLELKGSAMVDVKSGGMLTLKGGITKIN